MFIKQNISMSTLCFKNKFFSIFKVRKIYNIFRSLGPYHMSDVFSDISLHLFKVLGMFCYILSWITSTWFCKNKYGRYFVTFPELSINLSRDFLGSKKEAFAVSFPSFGSMCGRLTLIHKSWVTVSRIKSVSGIHFGKVKI